MADSDSYKKVLDGVKAQGQLLNSSVQSQTELENLSGGPDSVYGDEIDEQQQITNKDEAEQNAINEAIELKQQIEAEQEAFVAEGHKPPQV